MDLLNFSHILIKFESIFRRIEGLWHTAIVVYGNEYFFGGHGIACCVPGTTQLGPPLKQELLGMTAVSQVG